MIQFRRSLLKTIQTLSIISFSHTNTCAHGLVIDGFRSITKHGVRFFSNFSFTLFLFFLGKYIFIHISIHFGCQPNKFQANRKYFTPFCILSVGLFHSFSRLFFPVRHSCVRLTHLHATIVYWFPAPTLGQLKENKKKNQRNQHSIVWATRRTKSFFFSVYEFSAW